jgi:outer membrane lipoprotein
MTKRFLWLAGFLVLAATGCASTPRFDTAGVDTQVTPQAVTRSNAVQQGEEVLWGGVIVNSNNLADTTQIEVLAYPLDKEQRPKTDRGPVGRFMARAPGYLETADYAQGRLITIRGRLKDTMTGRIGEAHYTYPVVDILDSQLWQPETFVEPSRPRVNFGIGVMIGR